MNVASTREELSKRLLSASSTWTRKLPGSAPPRFWTVKLTGIESPAAAISTPVRKELPVKSGSSGAEVVSLYVQGIQPRRVTRDAAGHERRIVVVVRRAADADVVDARGRRLEAQLRVAPLLVVERQRRAVRIENSQEACQAAAGLLGVNAGVERLAFLQRYGVEIELVWNGQEVRHFRIVERAEVQRYSQVQGRGGKQGARFEPLPVRHPGRPPAMRSSAQASNSPSNTHELLPAGTARRPV